MLNNFFEPKSIAIIGASRTPGKLGYDLTENIIKGGYTGKIYPVNPNAESVLDLKAYPSVSNIEDNVDLAIIIVPALLVSKVLEECGAKHINAAIIISAGFKETGETGKKLEEEISAVATKHQISILGPNCLGISNPASSLNATFTKNMPKAGDVAFISQSGALISTILSLGDVFNLGFSKIISIGNKALIDETDFLEYLENDPATEVIIMYLESIRRGREFLEAAKRVTLKKPVIVIKAGISEEAARSVMSHTGALAGKDEVINAALKEANVLRVKTLDEFIFLAKLFSVGELPASNRIAVITNAGGMGVLASDQIGKTKLELAKIADKTREELKQGLPAAASTANPFDLIGDAKADRYKLALEKILADDNVDSLVVILTPQTMTEKEVTAQLVADFAKNTPKPIISVFSGGGEMASAKKILEDADILNFDTPETAVEILNKLWEYKEKFLRIQKEATEKCEEPVIPDKVKMKVKNILARSQKQVSLPDAFKILKDYKVPVVRSELAKSEKELVSFAKKIGYPVALKAFSPDIIHKTKTGGVAVNIQTPNELKAAHKKMIRQIRKSDKNIKIEGFIVQPMMEKKVEIIIGAKRDPQFGPTLMVGLGGLYTEVWKDISWGVSPINKITAKNMIFDLRAKKMLGDSSIDKICDIIVKVALIMADFPEIKELDINPVLINGDKAIAVDARMII